MRFQWSFLPVLKLVPFERLSYSRYESARVAMTNYHKTGGLTQHKFIFLQAWGLETDIKVSAGLSSFGVSLLGVLRAVFSLCSHLLSLLDLFVF